MLTRRQLPLMALRVFEVASRHSSFPRASEELGVSPAAIGQQIRGLEKELGVSLFNRTSRGLELTVEGQLALVPLREGIAKFREAIGAMQSHLSVDSISIAAPRDLAARWVGAWVKRLRSPSNGGCATSRPATAFCISRTSPVYGEEWLSWKGRERQHIADGGAARRWAAMQTAGPSNDDGKAGEGGVGRLTTRSTTIIIDKNRQTG